MCVIRSGTVPQRRTVMRTRRKEEAETGNDGFRGGLFGKGISSGASFALGVPPSWLS